VTAPAANNGQTLLEAVLADPARAAAECRRTGVSPAALRDLAGRTDSPQVRLFLALCPETPTRAIEGLCATPAAGVDERRALAAHPRTPPAALAQFASDADTPVRQAAAANPALPPAVASRLAEDPSWRVRQALAGNSGIAQRLHRVLGSDPSALVRAALRQQPRLDPVALEALSRDDDPAVRAAVVLDRHTPEEVLVGWADGDEALLQAFLLRRRGLPPTASESLCFSPYPAIQRQAVAAREPAPDEVVGWTREGSRDLRRDLAARADLSPLGVELLARDPEPAVRATLAANPRLPAATAEGLARDAHPEVRLALATNPAATARALLALLQQDDAGVRAVVATRGDLGRAHLELLFGSADDGALYALALTGPEWADLPALHAHRLQAHRLPSLRALAAPSRHLTRPMLEALAQDPCPEVRRRLCANPVLDTDLLARLAADPDPRVRDRATRRRDGLVAQPASLSQAPGTAAGAPPPQPGNSLWGHLRLVWPTVSP
jgi:hypothetical protein